MTLTQDQRMSFLQGRNRNGFVEAFPVTILRLPPSLLKPGATIGWGGDGNLVIIEDGGRLSKVRITIPGHENETGRCLAAMEELALTSAERIRYFRGKKHVFPAEVPVKRGGLVTVLSP